MKAITSMSKDKFVTVDEAADLLRIAPMTVRSGLKKGKLPKYKAGARTLIARSDLGALIDADTLAYAKASTERVAASNAQVA